MLALLLLAASHAPALAADGALRIGTSGDYQPFSFRTASGELTGFDVAVAQRLGHDLGREATFIAFRWPDLVGQLRAGAFEVAMSGVTVRADRALFVGFTRPYAVTGALAAVRATDREKFRNLADLDRENVRIAVNRGGHLEQVARQHFPHARLVPLENSGLQRALVRGDVDAAISEEFEVRTWSAAAFVTLGPFTHDRKAYAVRRESGELLGRINDWLAAREADGWLNEQRRRWLGDRSQRTPVQAGFDALGAAIDLRLQLMPFVAAVKRREHLPIEDPAQEARVIEHVRSAATAVGLRPEPVVDLFRVLMEAAKAVEHASPIATGPTNLTLAGVRAAVAAISDQLIAELARCHQWLFEPRWRDHLRLALRDGLTVPSARPFEEPLVNALRHVRGSDE
jgi:cyclohexadienyl dehydratase